VQIYNILKLGELFDFILARGVDDIYLNILDHPEYLNIRVMPAKLKQLAIERLQPYLHIKKVQSAIDYMMAEDWSHRWPEFIKYTATLDNSRSESITDLVPELK
jgi:hypothetical protein